MPGEIEELRRSLARAEGRLSTVLDLAFDGVARVSIARGVVLAANAALHRMLRFAEGALDGRPFAELFAPEERTRAAEFLRRTGEGRADGEARLLRADGQIALVEVRAIAIDGDGGDPAALVTVRDLSERRRLEEQLFQAQKMEAVGTLAGGVAHDFNNLLGAILGYASYLKRHVRPEDKLYRPVETIEAASERAAELVRRLLAFSRRAPTERRPFAPEGLVDETMRLFARSVPPSVKLAVEVQAGLPAIEGDETQVQQVLLNVCINAVDALRETGGGELKVRAALASPGEAPLERAGGPGAGPSGPAAALLDARPFVLLAVRDTGPGMAPEVRRRMFEPFFTTKGPGKGTGLGLATAYAIVTAHGGAIDVASEAGSGTEVRIFLRASDRPPESRRMDPIPERRGEGRVLVVDDEAVIRDLTKDILEERGFEVRLAASGEEALSRIVDGKEPYDLVVLDLLMPGLNGLETLKRIREARPEARVLLSSAYRPENWQAEMDRSGAVGFVQKPYRSSDLTQAVRAAIAQRR